MKQFKDIDELEAWLEPMDYQGFWYAIGAHNLVLQPRHHCDAEIASGEVDEATVLDVLKYFARLELAKRHHLQWREATPWVSLVESH